ncbi:glycosyltransferase family 4 protein [Paenibacillus kobensis]|uniref:glycosyltransferase family 4 protein n=1 Tax=Paenibacillus kobensis TaxID=59841 RepID=UPI000FD92EC6|nr:glycosyltransferase family 4 protein [Paenibacillus kobensis]
MRSKPRLFVFSHICSQTYVTGAEKLLLFMLRELEPYFQCTLVVPNDGYLSATAAARGIPVAVQPIPISVPLYLAQPHLLEELHQFRSKADYAALVHLLASQRPDAVLVNTVVHPMPAIAAKELGIPVVWSVMETIRSTPCTADAVTLIQKYSDWIVGISESTLQPIRTFYPQMGSKMLLLPPSWHFEDLAPDTWQSNRELRRSGLAVKTQHRLIGFIASSIYTNKGYMPFIEMAVEIAGRHPDALFLVVGNPVDRPLFDSGMDLARRSGIMDRFRWIRFENRIETIYPALDILVVPSMTAEGFGLTALEGLVFGKPVVAFASGGLAEVMQSTGNAVYSAAVGDVPGLVSRVDGLLRSGSEMAEVGIRNRAAVERAYGIAAYRSKLVHLLNAMKVDAVVKPHLVRGSTPVVYLLEDGKLRPFVSEKFFLEAGYSFKDVVTVDDATIRALPLGELIGTLEQPVVLPSPALPPAAPKATRGLHKDRKRSGKERRRQAGTGSRKRSKPAGRRRSSTRRSNNARKSRRRAKR